MNRRTFIAASGASVGLAGCATTDEEPDDGATDDGTGETDDPDSDAAAGDDAADADSDLDGRDDERVGDDHDEQRGDDHEDDSADDEDVEADETDAGGRSISFHSCSRATVTGTFADDDVAFANTGFYDDGLYGNTILEDGVVFGDDVAAPFSGTVVFEIGDDRSVSEAAEEVVVTVPEYGSDGTVITSLTTEREDYQMAGSTAGNPHAEDCLDDIAPDDEGGIEVASVETNAPVDAGEYIEATIELENPGTTAATETVELVVGHEPTVVDTMSVTLEGGERTTYDLGYETPPVEHDQEFPARIETATDQTTHTVTVYGTG